MAVAYVQSWSADGGAGTATSNTLTVSGATTDNLLVAVASLRTSVSGASFSATGWTLIQQEGTGSVAGAMFYRIATGDANDNFAASWGTSKRWSMAVSEYSGLATTSVLETSNENAAQLSSTTTTISTGSVSPSTAGLAVAVYGADMSSSTWAYTGITINSSFTKRVSAGQETVSNRAASAIADLDLTDTSAQNPTWSVPNAVQGTYAVIAAFAEPGAGGGISIPVVIHHRQNQGMS